jgi:ferrous iron transport protein A
MSLSSLAVGDEAVITSIDGDVRFLSRITSIGLTPGSKVKVIKNDRNRPLLLYSRDTMIALNKKECENIKVQEGVA